MNQNSIFSRSRFEYEGSHQYFLDEVRLQKLEAGSPVILYGSRGTGKTTLLNALNWREQVKNDYLINALGNKKYQAEYLGIYVKLPKVNIDSLSRWRDENELLYSQLFAYYLDLVWLEQLISAMSDLSGNQEIEVSASEERTACKKIAELFPALINRSSFRGKNLGFYDLATLIRTARESIEGASLYGESAAAVHERFSISGQVGDAGRIMSSVLHEIWVSKGLQDYKFKVCFDECECLDTFQVKVLSTIVRLSDHPTFFVYSFISLPEDFYSTLVKNLFIAKADIEHIPLDEMSDKEFERFAQGVVGVRLAAEGVENSSRFSNANIFGSLSLNVLLDIILKRSESKKSHDFVDFSQEQSSSSFYDYYKDEVTPHYYQSYLVRELNIESDRSSGWSKSRRSQESKSIRKKMVAAYLSICNELKTDPIYAGSDMVFQVCDKSIRDYLWLLHEIFVEFRKPLSEFISSDIPVEVQDKAIKLASANKIKSLPNSPLTDPGKIYRIVFGLGHLTSIIQRSSSDKSHLKSTERGLFVVTKGNSKYELDLLSLVIEAAEAGFLKIESNDQDQLAFRVHTSLAAHFGFSYRGAYYETRLEAKHIQGLKDSAGEVDLMEKVKTIAGTMYNMDSLQMSMDGI